MGKWAALSVLALYLLTDFFMPANATSVTAATYMERTALLLAVSLIFANVGPMNALYAMLGWLIYASVGIANAVVVPAHGFPLIPSILMMGFVIYGTGTLKKRIAPQPLPAHYQIFLLLVPLSSGLITWLFVKEAGGSWFASGIVGLLFIALVMQGILTDRGLALKQRGPWGN